MHVVCCLNYHVGVHMPCGRSTLLTMTLGPPVPTAPQAQAVLFAFTTTTEGQLRVLAWQANNTANGEGSSEDRNMLSSVVMAANPPVGRLKAEPDCCCDWLHVGPGHFVLCWRDACVQYPFTSPAPDNTSLGLSGQQHMQRCREQS
jgi:hypothetical protein